MSSIRGVLMTERWVSAMRRELKRQASEQVVEITVALPTSCRVVCTQRVAECAASRSDWVCGACERGFVSAVIGAQCNVCEATVVAVAYE